MSALPPKADMDWHGHDVRFVPKADILRCGKKTSLSITSSARASRVGGIVRPSVLAVLRLMINSNLDDREIHRHLPLPSTIGHVIIGR
jgi:hypothetical protein